MKDYSFQTRAVRGGHRRSPEGEQSEPIFATSSFVFDDAEQAAARFSETEPGNVYSRFTNPTVRTFQDRLALLDGGEACMATASGMGAILATCLALLKAGDHVVSSRSLFGSTIKLFVDIFGRFGVTFDFVSPVDLNAWEEAIKPNTRILFLETPSNPLSEIADIGALADLAHANGARLVVDNTLCTPALQRPLEFGADITIYSATKFIDGQGRCVGGAVVGPRKEVGEDVYKILRSAGPSMSPFNAWIFLKGLETLKLRMSAISAAALSIAKWLQDHPLVSRVYYPGLESHPQFDLVCHQQSAGGGVISFEIDGGKQSAWKFIDGTQFISQTANLGDTKSTITHPATTTHGRLSGVERTDQGIKDTLIRVSVGLEDLEDIKADLECGFAATKQ